MENNHPAYDPKIHCCTDYYKDICSCVQQKLRESKQRKNTRNVNGTLKLFKLNKVQYEETKTFNVVSVDYKNQKLFISLKKDKNGLIKCRFEGSAKWYTYAKEKLIIMITGNPVVIIKK